MIPYLHASVIPLGPIALQVWGLCVALGILVGLFVAGRWARRAGLDTGIVYDTATWSLVGAFLGARLLHVTGYAWSTYAADPMEILRIWHGGFSSVGGFLGAALVGVWYLRRRQVNVHRYVDTMIFGLPIGLGIGRIGCFLIHDHPGTATHFFLSVQYPDGVTRHDHGLYLSINGFLMALWFWLLSRKPRPQGLYLATFLTWYGIVRFFLDFWRVGDMTYFGLTPAQYVAAVMASAGVWLLARVLLGDGDRDKVGTL